MVRVPGVILVEKCDQIALGAADAEIARSGLPTILFFEQRDLAARADHARDDSAATVGRAVVDQNDFVRLQRLGKDTVEGLLDVGRAVIKRQHDRNRRHREAPRRYETPRPYFW